MPQWQAAARGDRRACQLVARRTRARAIQGHSRGGTSFAPRRGMVHRLGLDRLLRRAFPALVLCLIAAAACLQAYGLGHLVAATFVLPPVALRAPAARPAGAARDDDHATRADAMLARNPFDSVTGPLD